MEPSDAIEPFPELPSELVRLIIEKLLEIEPERAPALACLSRDIQPIVERALYRCVVLRHHMYPQRFVAMIKSSRRPDTFYRDRVKGSSSWESTYDNDISTEEPVHACIDALASSGPRPSKLACDYDLTLRPDDSHRFGLSLFENVTHLELNLGQELTNFDGKQLHAMKNLTHLALVDTDPPEPLSQIKSLLRKLHLADSIAVCII